MKEVFQRLSAVEQELATHVAICGERAKAMERTLHDMCESLHEVKERVQDLGELRSRVKGGYLLAVGGVFLLLEMMAVGISLAALLL